MSNIEAKPRIAISMGDPAGIGPEIVARICADEEIRSLCDLVVVGRSMLLRAGALACNIDLPRVELVEAGQGAEITPGSPSKAGGAQAGAFIETAARMCLAGEAAAMVTAPISKYSLQLAGYTDTGHTTMLARITDTPRPVMMLAGSRLRVVLATIHCSIREMLERLDQKTIVEVGWVSHQAFQRYMGMASPRIAVAALNPHAGEEGLFGDEEQAFITPAVQELQNMGVRASGPYPPDTLYWRAANGEFDLVVGMYHDQALIPLKLLHFEDGVNVTLGLPIIRTSVDHGTAYDLAGKGKANPASLKEAVKMAVMMANNAAENSPA